MCVFRAGGKDFDVDAFVATSSLKPYQVFRRGEPRFERSKRPDRRHWTRSGLKVAVSECGWDDLAGQIEDATRFIEVNEQELRRLRDVPELECSGFDFPSTLRIGSNDIVVESHRFPAALLALAGSVGADIELTIYPPSSSDDDEGDSDGGADT